MGLALSQALYYGIPGMIFISFQAFQSNFQSDFVGSRFSATCAIYRLPIPIPLSCDLSTGPFLQEMVGTGTLELHNKAFMMMTGEIALVEKHPLDLGAYEKRVKKGPCFICELVAGNNRHHIIYEDQTAVVFLNKYPVLYGYTLVAPRDHWEQATGDFTLPEYLQLQQLIYQVAEALKQVVPTERLYILTLGSQQGNRHVHWHLVPLPPGVPYEQQQTAALDLSRGVLAIPDDEMASLARSIRQVMERLNPSSVLPPSN